MEATSLRLAAEVLGASKRQSAPVTKSFVRSAPGGGASMMRSIYVGGRGGDVALKLYLSLLWRCSAAPYESRRDSSRAWASLVGLDPTDQNGTRRVQAALRKLAGLRLLELEPDPGFPPTIRLLSEDGSGKVYIPAYNKYQLSRDSALDSRSLYFKVPATMWTTGVMQEMRGPALAMYLVLASEQAYLKPQWFSTEQFPERYGLSAGTRAEGTRALEELGLLEVSKQILDDRGRELSFGGRPRVRKLYKLVGAAVPER